MTILIYNYKHETELLIYEFTLIDLFGKFEFSYEGFQISRRNDKNDIWGHQWSDHFANQKYKEQAEYVVYSVEGLQVLLQETLEIIHNTVFEKE